MEGFEDGASDGACEIVGLELGTMDTDGLVVSMTALTLVVESRKNGSVTPTSDAKTKAKKTMT